MTIAVATDGVAAADWREAVVSAASALVDAGAAGEGYPEACVRVVEENGPYIVLTKGLALVHARPEEGGLAVGVGVTRLAAPVEFGHPDNDPVDLLLAFCTPDPDVHVGTLAALARALSGGLADRLRAAAGRDDLARELKEALPDD
ncbi:MULTISPECIES: PTS sugar transporter subunit IIA [Actinomadura]|uniref:Ascorbate-specific PTS system EIIA component n=1 Tax=Actinomadura litoris TaxID=2678616 RepID=A0A7K1KZ32_9ACTN|nr:MULTISPECIES: PTS sugar transporter subunit IIA [Actinomadura]MBT2212312.1 PTS sugar transporter subunit IIA [Actinomadura sp. NEAU-AAG7]MUN37196.1 PTS sugar transporter subunit IIA [Actinomadura litoris]